jgi:hypothetical protein
MKSYPSITREIRSDLPIYAFDKLDGSNIRAEWAPRQGFYKFGSRRRLLNEEQLLGEARELVLKKYAQGLTAVFEAERYEAAVCFFEFYGPGSFAGRHRDEEHTVTLFDVNPYKKGILEPEAFLKLFGHLDTPRLLYRGPADAAFVGAVRSGALPGISGEGVVCKAKSDKRTPMPILFKIKTNAWIARLKELCGEDEALFRELL